MRIGRGDPEAQIVARAADKDQRDHRRAADQRAQRRETDVLLQEAAEDVVALGEDPADQTEGDGGDRHIGQHDPIEGDMGQARHVADMVLDVMNPPGAAGVVGDQRSRQTRNQRRILHPAHGQHLQREHRPGQRRAEHRAEPGGDPGHQKDAHIVGVELEQLADPAGQTAAHLHGGAFAARRAAEQVGQHGRDQHERRHAQRHAAARLMNLLQDQVVAALGGPALPQIDEADQKPRDGQEVQQPRMRVPQVRRPVQRPQEHGARRPHRNRHRSQKQGPAQHGRRKHGQGAQSGSGDLTNRHDSTFCNMQPSRNHQLIGGAVRLKARRKSIAVPAAQLKAFPNPVKRRLRAGRLNETPRACYVFPLRPPIRPSAETACILIYSNLFNKENA